MMRWISNPEADDRVGYCPIGDITYCGPEQPIIHGDETGDREVYEVDFGGGEDAA